MIGEENAVFLFGPFLDTLTPDRAAEYDAVDGLRGIDVTVAMAGDANARCDIDQISAADQVPEKVFQATSKTRRVSRTTR